MKITKRQKVICEIENYEDYYNYIKEFIYTDIKNLNKIKEFLPCCFSIKTISQTILNRSIRDLIHKSNKYPPNK